MPDAERQEAIDEALRIVERLLDDERTRGQGLDTKTATLAGFAGVVLSLTADFGREALSIDLGSVGDLALRLAFLVAVIFLSMSAVLALVGVLRPQKHLGITTEQVRDFPKLMTSRTKTQLQGSMVSTIATLVFERERRLNDHKARMSRLSGSALLVGLVAVAVQALTLVLHELGV